MKYLNTALWITLLLVNISCSNNNEKKVSSEPSKRSLTVATVEDPLSFDPRLVRDLPTVTVMRLLYEGLMRTDAHGKLVPAVAEKVEISEDQKTYTFTLRPSFWSDGTPLTAEDFESSWKSVLSPQFPAPNAYQLYVIRGAKDAKEGRLPIESIGVKASTPSTLIVELEQPTPYFLELTSCHFYFPVSPQMRQNNTLLSPKETHSLVVNGPFKVETWIPRSELTANKNPFYWDASAVSIESVTLQVLDENTALQLFKNGQLHWAGSPLSTLPQDAVTPLKQQGVLQVAPGAGTHWFRFNTDQYPFDNEKMRRAFALALDRQAIVDHVTQGNQLPALGIVPPIFGLGTSYDYVDHNVALAQHLFYTALEELEIVKEKLPQIVLSYASNDRNHKIAQAVQQQWNKTFGIHIALESNEGKAIVEKIRNGIYQIGLGSWYADITDPINFLEIFKSRLNPTNQTSWQNADYTALLEQSSQELIPTKRLAILSAAEKKLLEGMPVAPLFHSSYNYLKKPEAQGVYFSPLGYLDFKEASLITTVHPEQ